ncbi:MAG: aromatic ring-hydroxylating dioxygenase subunit alpha, partial [Proteobacteria bacterium]|nr:aromatic ring-hydroxylating dioxygenase subunit alpha [Pseudomonadota bacterium]
MSGLEIKAMSSNLAELQPHPSRKFTSNALHSATLPASLYYDPAVAEREKQEIFFKTWQFVGFVADIKQPGDYLTYDLLDQKILVSRGKDNALRAFYNVCMHRGHILAEGQGNKSIFTCPFHAWSYDTTGALKAAGNAENVAGFRLEDFTLSEIRCEVWANMIFVNLDDGAASMASMYGALEHEIRAAVPNFDGLVFARRDTYDIACNWKIIFDGLECYHCPVIHPQAMGNPDSFMPETFDSYEYDWYSTHIVRADMDVINNHPERLPYPITPGDDVIDDYIWYMWPNYIFLAHPGSSNFHVTHALPSGLETVHRT